MAEQTRTTNDRDYFIPAKTGVSTNTTTQQANVGSTASTIDTVGKSIADNAEAYGQTSHQVVTKRYAIKRG